MTAVPLGALYVHSLGTAAASGTNLDNDKESTKLQLGLHLPSLA